METVKKIKNVLCFIINVICTPALIYHEICHLLTCLITWTRITDITIGKSKNFKKDFSYNVQIYSLPSSYTKNLFISISPFIGAVLLYVLCLYTDSYILYTYCFFTAKVLLPSQEDYETINMYKSDEDILSEMGLDLEEFEILDENEL